MEQEYTVTKLSILIKKSLEFNFDNIKLTAEISSLKIAPSGHAYFSLKDENSVIDAICWRGTMLSAKYKLELGSKVTCYGKVSSYPMQSKYQFIVDRFEPAGVGNLLKLLEERKQKLAKEGLFDQKLKKKIPKFPKRIGVITSKTGAVIRDIIHRVKERFPTEILLWPVLVQGTEAASQIVVAIDGMNALPKEKQPDVLIIARGGGSVEDLMPFNEETIARAVFRSKIPVISAIGHETDTTIIDYVADLRAPTPTAAAELATPDKIKLIQNLNMFSSQLHNSLENILKNRYLRLKATGPLDATWFISVKKQRLDISSERLSKNLTNFIGSKKYRLAKIQLTRPDLKHNINELSERLNKNIEKLITDQKLRLTAIQISLPKIPNNLPKLEETLKFAFLNIYNKAYHRLNLTFTNLESCSYLTILRKGFIWAETPNKEPINSYQKAKDLRSFILNFSDGSLTVSPHKPSETKSS